MATSAALDCVRNGGSLRDTGDERGEGLAYTDAIEPIELGCASSSSAEQRAFRKIRSLILVGALNPGEKVTETHMARLSGISRTPIRNAFRQLENELYLTRNETGHHFVADFVPGAVTEISALRAHLEEYAIKRAAKYRRAELVEILENSVGSIGDSPTLQSFINHDAGFHRLIVSAADAPHLSRLHRPLANEMITKRAVCRYSPKQIESSVNEHWDIIHCLSEGDIEMARKLLRDHIVKGTA